MPSSSRRRFLHSLSLFTTGSLLATKLGETRHSELKKLMSHLPDDHDWSHLADQFKEWQNDLDVPDWPEISHKLPNSPASSPKEPPRRVPLLPESFPSGSYGQFLGNHSFRYIRPHEVLRPHQRMRQGIANRLPPASLWPRIIPTLRVADELRHRLGQPLRLITSAYRCPAYNRVCGGASRSMHLRNNALDLIYDAPPKAAYQIALDLRRNGFFQGGIGLYKGFIHLDTRGHNATWTS